MSRGVAPGAALLLLLGCAHSGQSDGRKGGLKPAPEYSATALAQRFEPRQLALVAGVNEFDAELWPDLRFALADAVAVEKALVEKAPRPFDVVVRPAPGPATSLAALRASMRAIAAHNERERDVIMVYLSTHGTLWRDSRGRLRRYLILSDTDADSVEASALSVAELYRWFEALPSKRKVLILATCHSGDGKSALGSRIQAEASQLKSPFFIEPLESVSSATMVLSATGWGQSAREDPRLGHDIYTHFLLEALREGDRNQDGAVTISEAHDYARDHTYYFTGGRQTPEAQSHIRGQDPIVLSGERRRRGAPEVFSWDARLQGLEVWVDGQPKGALPGGVALARGSRRVELRRGAEVVFTEQLELSPGERIELAELAAAPPGPRVGLRTAAQLVLGAGRDEARAPAALAGISLEWPDLLLPQLALVGEVLAGGGRGRAATPDGPTDYSALHVVGRLAARHRREIGDFSWFVEPNVAGIYLRRSADRAGLGSREFFTVAPGLGVGAGWSLSTRWRLGLQLEANYLALRRDGERLDSAFTVVGLDLSYELK